MTTPTAPITDADLRAVRDAVEKMTPGPWKANNGQWAIWDQFGDIAVADIPCHTLANYGADLPGIVLLRNHARGLFARLEAAEREVERLKGEVQRGVGCGDGEPVEGT